MTKLSASDMSDAGLKRVQSISHRIVEYPFLRCSMYPDSPKPVSGKNSINSTLAKLNLVI
jgi:hypothetical protein